MNTPSQSEAYMPSPVEYGYAPRRNVSELVPDLTGLRSFSEYEEAESAEFERFSAMEAERQRLGDIISSVNDLDYDNWVLRGPKLFTGVYPTL